MRYTITRNAEIVAMQVRIQGTQKKSIMGENILSINFESFEYIDIRIGDKLTFLGEEYTFKDLPDYKKISSRKHQYSTDLKAKHYDLANYSLFSYNADNELVISDFSIIGNAELFLDLIISNANRDGAAWLKGDVAATDAKLMPFSDQNCLSALTDLAIGFNLEWWIIGQTISLRTKAEIIQDITFEYGKGKGLYNLFRQNVNEKSLVTRLFVYGSEKNLPPNYRGNYTKRLQMPVGIDVLEKNIYEIDGVTIKYGVRERTIKSDDIFPRRTGSVTSTTALDEFSFFDTAIDFNINYQLLPGTSAKLTFNTGSLSGYTFTINSFDNATKKVTINKNDDEKAFEVPSFLLRAVTGDEYVLSDIEMPNSYVLNAELELQDYGQDYLDKNSEPQVTYAGDCDKFEAKRRDIKPILGNYVKVKDADLILDKNIRVNSITVNIEDEWDYSFELNDTSAINSAVLSYAAAEKREKQIYKNTITSILEKNKLTDLTAKLKGMAYEDIVELAKLGDTIIEGGFLKSVLMDADYIKASIVNSAYIEALDIIVRNLKTKSIGRRIELIGDDNSLKFYNSNGRLAIELKETDGVVAFNIYDTYGNFVYQLGQNVTPTSPPTPAAPPVFHYEGYSASSQAAANYEVTGGAHLHVGDLFLNDVNGKYYDSWSGTYPFTFGSYPADGFYASGDVSGVTAELHLIGGVPQ